MAETIPIILDTDIGGDIDDTWALIFMLRCPELDVRLITSAAGNTPLRARIIARLLQVAGRTDIPIGIGPAAPGSEKHLANQHEWVKDYDLATYPGTVHADGAAAIAETIRAADRPVTVVATGPLPTVAEALRRDPTLTARSRFVGMHGSIRQGYGGSLTPCAESNVKNFTADCQYVFAADWPKTITPLDTCGHVVLDGEPYQRIRNADDPLLRALRTNNDLFARHVRWTTYDPTERSSTLFDTVAVYLAFSEDLVEIEQLPLVVTDDGYTRLDDAGTPVRCATAWRDLDAFKHLLAERLLQA